MLARPALLAALLVLFSASSSLASWPNGLSASVEIAPGSESSLSSEALLPDGSGGVFVAFTKILGPDSDIYLQRFTSNGGLAPGWPTAGVAVCTAAGQQFAPRMVADGSGGVVIVWSDLRNSRFDIFAQRVRGDGTFQPGWTATGVPVAVTANNKFSFSICADGTGGAFVGYDFEFTPTTDLDVYLARVENNGTVITTPISTPTLLQQRPAVSADGGRGCFIAWEDNTPGHIDIRGARYDSSLAVVIPTKNLCVAPGDQQSVQIVTTGTGRAVVLWNDLRFGPTQILGNTMFPNGSIGYDFGTSIYATSTGQSLNRLVPDGGGGYFVAWDDDRPGASGLYLRHYQDYNQAWPGWAAGGLYLGAGPFTSSWIVALAPDASLGALVSWIDPNQTTAIYGTHVDALGTRRPLSVPGGNLLVAGSTLPYQQSLGPDGAGGAFLVRADARLWIQYVDPFLATGDPYPTIASVRDLPADQGGKLRITWNASWQDNTMTYTVGSYWVWRQVPLTLAENVVRAGGSWLDDSAPDAVPQSGFFRRPGGAELDYAWEFVAQQPANQSAQYSYVATTESDSTSGHNPYTVFLVEAHAAADSRAYWPTAPDSGYSVDNLPPAMPQPFTGSYAPSNTTLDWGANSESDLAGYRLYRGTTPGFVPAPSNRIASLTSLHYDDSGAPPSIYKLTAVDAHGNESPWATVVPSGVLAAGDERPLELTLDRVSANPSRDGAAFQLALPAESRVRLDLFDVAGRNVRTVADVALPAGFHRLVWDGRDRAGARLPSGVYLARLLAQGHELRARVVLTH